MTDQAIQLGGDLLLGAILLLAVVLIIFRKHVNWEPRRRHGSSCPTVNIDGAPMCGHVDINGNAYGVTRMRFDR